MGGFRWEPLGRLPSLGIGCEGKPLTAIWAAEGAVNGRRPRGIILDAVEVGVGGEFDDPTVFDKRAQAADEAGHFPAGGETAFLGKGIAVFAGH
jgi:hypothetical protein